MRSTAPCRTARSRQFRRPRQPPRQSSSSKAAGYNVLGDPRPGGDRLCLAPQDQRRHLSVARRADRRISAKQVSEYGSLAKIPAAAVGNTRNDMYLASEAMRFLMKDKENDLSARRKSRRSTPTRSRSTARPSSSRLWVKVAVAIALGLGTMIGWKRIVVTVGEKIGKTPSDLWPGRLGRAGRHGDDRRGRHVRPAGLDHPCAVLGRRRHDGGQRLGPADGRRCATC